MPASFFPKKALCILVVGLSVSFGSIPAFPQSITGRILGNVNDSSGAALKDATVVITDLQRGTSRTLTTDEGGMYVAPIYLPAYIKLAWKLVASGQSNR